MTLVLTRLTKSGIAMAADSAETGAVNIPGGRRHTVTPSAVQKLFAIEGLNAGVSCWGRGEINGESTSAWLQRFMVERGNVGSLKVFAERLASALNEEFRRRLDGEPSIGFHVAGFESDGSGMTFHHVHDGRSQYFKTDEPWKVTAHHDWPPEKLKGLFDRGSIQEMRNGSFGPYAIVREGLGKALDELSRNSWPNLLLGELDVVVRYNVMEIRLISDLYDLFGQPVVGGKVHSLAINAEGAGPVVAHDNASGITKPFTFDDPPNVGTGGSLPGAGSGVSVPAQQPPRTGCIPETSKTFTYGP